MTDKLICPKCKQVVTKLKGMRRLSFYCDCGYAGPFITIDKKNEKDKSRNIEANAMEICPRCRKAVNPSNHFTLSRSRDISQIECECGYRGLPVQLEKPPDKKVKKNSGKDKRD